MTLITYVPPNTSVSLRMKEIYQSYRRRWSTHNKLRSDEFKKRNVHPSPYPYDRKDSHSLYVRYPPYVKYYVYAFHPPTSKGSLHEFLVYSGTCAYHHSPSEVASGYCEFSCCSNYSECKKYLSSSSPVNTYLLVRVTTLSECVEFLRPYLVTNPDGTVRSAYRDYHHRPPSLTATPKRF